VERSWSAVARSAPGALPPPHPHPRGGRAGGRHRMFHSDYKDDTGTHTGRTTRSTSSTPRRPPLPLRYSSASSALSDRVRTLPGAAAAAAWAPALTSSRAPPDGFMFSVVVPGVDGLSTPGRPRCCHARTASRAARMPLSALSLVKFLPASHVRPPGARRPLASSSATVVTVTAWRHVARTFDELLEDE
jgi:hypothetical protein